MPSSPTLRQRLDLAAASSNDRQTIFSKSRRIYFVRLKCRLRRSSLRSGASQRHGSRWIWTFLPSTTATKKEGVSRTYKGTDGLRRSLPTSDRKGTVVNVNLREGSTHVQKEAPAFLQQHPSCAVSVAPPIPFHLWKTNLHSQYLPGMNDFPLLHELLAY